MRKPIHLYFYFFVLFLLSSQVSAQSVSNVNARQSGENVVISYDLVGTKTGEKFRIELFSSADNYQAPLQAVSGNVGEDQLGGPGKQITWRAKEELGVFTGNITFEVRSTITFSPIQITSPTSSSSFKPGSPLPIKWNGGMPSATLQMELLKANEMSRSIGTSSNTGMYNWVVPKDLGSGVDYQVRMYDINDRINTEIATSNFIIKKKGGAGKFLIPLAVVGAGAGAYFAFFKKDTTPPPPPVVNTDLPSPPDPSGNLSTSWVKTGRPWISIPISF